MDSAEVVFRYFSRLPQKQIEAFNQLQALYAQWNTKVNLISRKDIDSLYLKHVLHSLAIFRFMPFEPNTRVLDLGTGGGFPGIPLAIVNPQAQFTLADSIGKKVLAAKAVSDTLGLTNVNFHHGRAENLTVKFDFVVSRAVAPLSDLMRWTQGKWLHKSFNPLPNGLICLKGGDLNAEIRQAGRQVQVFELNRWFEDPFFESKCLLYVPMA